MTRICEGVSKVQRKAQITRLHSGSVVLCTRGCPLPASHLAGRQPLARLRPRQYSESCYCQLLECHARCSLTVHRSWTRPRAGAQGSFISCVTSAVDDLKGRHRLAPPRSRIHTSQVVGCARVRGVRMCAHANSCALERARARLIVPE